MQERHPLGHQIANLLDIGDAAHDHQADVDDVVLVVHRQALELGAADLVVDPAEVLKVEIGRHVDFQGFAQTRHAGIVDDLMVAALGPDGRLVDVHDDGGAAVHGHPRLGQALDPFRDQRPAVGGYQQGMDFPPELGLFVQRLVADETGAFPVGIGDHLFKRDQIGTARVADEQKLLDFGVGALLLHVVHDPDRNLVVVRVGLARDVARVQGKVAGALDKTLIAAVNRLQIAEDDPVLQELGKTDQAVDREVRCGD